MSHDKAIFHRRLLKICLAHGLSRHVSSHDLPCFPGPIFSFAVSLLSIEEAPVQNLCLALFCLVSIISSNDLNLVEMSNDKYMMNIFFR